MKKKFDERERKMTLTILDFAGKNIRFEMRGDRAWVSLTDMAKATGRQVNHWNELKDTPRLLKGFETITGIPVMVSNVGGSPENTGTWALKEVAISFAMWCNVDFHIWVCQQIDILMTTGTVSIAPTQHQLPATYIEALEALLVAEKEKEALMRANELLSVTNGLLQDDVETLSEVVDELFDYSSIIRIAKFNGINEKAFNWYNLKAASKVLKVEVKTAPCPRYGKKNLYSHDAWRLAYPDAKLPETTTLVIARKDSRFD
jgi:hypothetical protein